MLKFVDQAGAYNFNTDAVRFFALDGDHSVMFTVSREALADLERTSFEDGFGEQEGLAAFGNHIDRIRHVAEQAYRRVPGSFGAYVLATAHFGGGGSST